MLKDCHMGFMNCFATHTLLPIKGENVFIADPGRAIKRCFIYSLEYKAIGEAQRWREKQLPAPPLPPFQII